MQLPARPIPALVAGFLMAVGMSAAHAASSVLI